MRLNEVVVDHEKRIRVLEDAVVTDNDARLRHLEEQLTELRAKVTVYVLVAGAIVGAVASIVTTLIAQSLKK